MVNIPSNDVSPTTEAPEGTQEVSPPPTAAAAPTAGSPVAARGTPINSAAQISVGADPLSLPSTPAAGLSPGGSGGMRGAASADSLTSPAPSDYVLAAESPEPATKSAPPGSGAETDVAPESAPLLAAPSSGASPGRPTTGANVPGAERGPTPVQAAMAAATASPGQGATSTSPPGSQGRPGRVPSPNVMAVASNLLDRLDPEVSNNVREVGWHILERFSRVTRASRDAATRILDHPLSRPILPILPRDISTMSTTYRPEQQTGSALEAMVREFPGAGMYLAQWVHRRVRGQQPAAGYEMSPVEVWSDSDEEGECGEFEVLSNDLSLPKPVARRNAKHALTAELWVQYISSNFKQSIALEGFPASETAESSEPSITQVIEEIKERIFYGGVDPDVRPQVWKFLLGYLPWGSTESEQAKIVASKRENYEKMRDTWMAHSKEGMTPEEWEDRRHLIVKDVVRTDRHHAFFGGNVDRDLGDCPTNQEEEDMLLEELKGEDKVHPNLRKLRNVLMTYVQYLNEIGRNELGYVQGMSDLCSHFLMLQDGNESDTFWCFVGFMERLHPNFNMNQQAMHHQLSTLRGLLQFLDYPLFRHLSKCDALNMFFAFRWLLIWFKREFSTPDVLRVWETCLSDVRSPEYQLFVALAILDLNRRDIITHLSQFDEVLKFVNELAENLDVEAVLTRAEELYWMFENKLRIVRARIAAAEGSNASLASNGSGGNGSGGNGNGGPGRTTAHRVGTVDRELSKSLRSLSLADL